jgi:acyl-coenzyme A synthetase/AMP-(fatty) acid ligase/3-hydroxymyristoyl/3-hydroxydecanoyl-(acyl carrier protein) dehydratase
MTQISSPISHLFALPRGADHVVAVHADRQYSWDSFRRDVGALAARLTELGGDRWLVIETDAYALAVGVLAALHAGTKAVLPSNLQEGHLNELAPTVDGTISNSIVVDSAACQIRTFGEFKEEGAPALRPLDPELSEIVLHTSGTTGAPVSVHKPLRCLDAEIVALNKTFNPESGKLVLATVPPYHIYGLLFRVLWPLATGRPFSTEMISYPEELRATAKKNPGSLLVSSPAFLKRALPILDIDEMGTFLGPVFSSGGPLPPAIAATYNRSLPASLSEVYGSTETGGIGYRIVSKETPPEPWQPLPGVDINAEQTERMLFVRSPFLVDEGWQATGDRASIRSDGKFTLEGRADKIVKVEELRVSLSEMERRLDRCAIVEATRIIRLPLEEHKRQILAAVIKPSAAGWDILRTEGRRTFRTQLLSVLTLYFAPVALPRKWRFVTQLPEDERGKITETALSSIFKNSRAQKARPVVSTSNIGREEASFNLHLPKTLSYFEGHFEEAAILAGVVQLDWAIFFAKENFPIAGNFQRIEALKFHKVLTPGDDVSLALQMNLETGRLNFRYENAGTKYSSGRVIFEMAT